MVSFALTEEAVCEAHAATSGGEDEVVEPDVEVYGVDSHPERTLLRLKKQLLKRSVKLN